jgi:predicted  nucleic acid-binding Zn-ribbon protein
MESEELKEKMEALERKLFKLVKEHRALKEELADVQKEKKELEAIVEKQKEELKNFQNKFKISKIVSTIATESHDAGRIRLIIDEYIREIDKCIAHLSE